MSKQGMILFAHGSRDPLWSKPIEAIAKAISQRASHAMVRCAYLELMQPELAQVVSDMVGSGITAIQIAPMFLGVGKHAREDLPALVKDLQILHPSISLVLQSSIGEHPAVVDCIANVLSKPA